MKSTIEETDQKFESISPIERHITQSFFSDDREVNMLAYEYVYWM